MFVKSILSAAAAVFIAGTAFAAPVTTSFVIGTVDGVSTDASVFDFSLFQLNERVRLNLTFDDAVGDTNSFATSSTFSDPTATLELVGITSGTVLSLADGLRVRANDNTNRLSFDSILNSPTIDDPLVFKNAIDFVVDEPAFLDVNDLSAVLADVDLTNDQIGRHSINFFSPTTGESAGLWIAAIPLPATGLALIGGLGLMGLSKRRKRA